jgi:hypothetical protein
LTAPTSFGSTGLFDDDDLPPLSDDDDEGDSNENENDDTEDGDVKMYDVDLDQLLSRQTHNSLSDTTNSPQRFSNIGPGSPGRPKSLSMSISGVWRCNKCTLINSKPFAPVCEMCGSSRIEDCNVDTQVVKLQSSLLVDRCAKDGSLRRGSSPASLNRKGVDEFVDVPLGNAVPKEKQAKKLHGKNMSMPHIMTEKDALKSEALSRGKGIRDALSIRIVRSEVSSFTSYHIRVIDMSTGFRWIVKRRYRQFYQLQQQMTRLTSEYPWQNARNKHEIFVEARALRRITALEFPSRAHLATMMQRTKPTDGSKTKRQVQLESFLRHVSALVAPVPIGDVRAKALLLLQDFLDVDMYKKQLDEMDIFTHGTDEQKGIARVKVKTYQILNDPYTKEGSAILRYLTKFEKMLAEGEKTKEFILELLEEMAESIDDICTYILEHHKVAKALLLPATAKKRNGINKNSHHRINSVMTNMEQPKAAPTAIEDGLSHKPGHGRRGSMPAMHLSPFCGVSDLLATSDFLATNDVASSSDGFSEEVDSPLREAEESDENEARAADLVRAMVEDSIFSPTYEDLFTHLSLVEQAKEFDVQKKAGMLRSKSQSFFEIPEAAQSPSGWKDVVCILSELDRHRLPSDKQRVLTAAAHMIAVLHRNEHSDRPAEDTVLSADELLPIFIYCIVHSTISSFLVTKVGKHDPKTLQRLVLILVCVCCVTTNDFFASQPCSERNVGAVHMLGQFNSGKAVVS